MTDAAHQPMPMARLVVTILLPFGAGYFFSFVCRNINAVLAPQLVAEFGLDASQIGILTAGYVFAAAIQMVPLALLLDRYGPRRVLICQFCVTTFACVLTVLAESFATLTVARVILGIGIAGCLPTAFKAVTIWFAPERYATGNGIMLFAGGLGAIAATRPVQMLLDVLDWREFFIVLALAMAAIAIVSAFIIPAGNVPRPRERRSNLSVYGEILRHPVYWRIMPAASIVLAGYFSIQGLWANAWMSDVAGLDQAAIGNRLFAMAIAMAAGMLVNGALGDELARRGFEFAAFMAIGMALVVATGIVFTFALAPGAYWPWILFGFAGNSGSLVHPILYRIYPVAFAARAVSTIGVISLAMMFAIQSGFGLVLDLWGTDGAGRYPPEAYRFGFGLIVAAQFVCLIWFLGAVPRLRAMRAAGART